MAMIGTVVLEIERPDRGLTPITDPEEALRAAPSAGETQSFRIESRVMSADLNEDPSVVEIRFSDSPPPGVPTPGSPGMPNPMDPVPPPPLGFPSFSIKDEALDRIMARVVLGSTSFSGTTFRDSDAVLDTF